MTIKHRVIIGLSALGTLALAGIIALIAIMASFTAEVEGGGFSFTFTATRMNVEVEAGYFISTSTDVTDAAFTEFENATYTTIQTTDNENVMSFKCADGATETKSFKKPEIQLENGQVLCLRYKLTISGIDGDQYYSEFYGTNSYSDLNSNVSVYSSFGGMSFSFQYETGDIGMIGPLQAYVGEPFYVYLKIFATEPTQNMYYDGTFSFNMYAG